MQTVTPEEVVLKTTLSADGQGRQSFITSLYTNADVFYQFAPWKYVPGTIVFDDRLSV